jgi:hypothetical protein
VKIIFLDFDGVLLTPAYQLEHGGGKLEPEKVRLLQGLLEATNARIVVSSNWRSTVGKMRLVLQATGLRDARKWVIGVTPRFRHNPPPWLTSRHADRGDEIQAWLLEHPEVTAFVILDDGNDMGRACHRLVQTDPYIGLCEGAVEEAKRVLKSQEAL